MNELIKKLTQFLPSFSFRLDGNKRLALLAAAAIAATAIIVSVLWNSNHGYVSLYGSQEHLPVSQIVTVLDGEKLEYRIDPQSGQILVPEEALSKTRMTLAAKGVQAMLPSGYELMDKDEVLGASQFVQNVRYKRSLEGELAQSIMTLDAVESARVHLALNEESSFVVSDEPQNSASVVVRLHYGSKLDMDQVNAIVHLVSGSVPNLNASKVSVVDQAGNLLSDGIGAGEAVSAATRKRDQILKDIQDKTRASLANVLDSLVGTGNYRVSVMPDLDLSNIDETQEHYGDTPKVNREETVLDSDTNQIAMGIPGSLSNRPPLAANQVGNGATATTPEDSRQPAALSKHSENKRDYSWDRSVEHIQHPGFDIKRLNVAIVLNQSAPALKNWKPEQTTQLTALLNNAAGIDAKRGDNLSLSLLNFVPQSIPVEPTLPLWKDGELDSKPPHQQKDYMQGGQDGQAEPYPTLTGDDRRERFRDYYAEIELIDDQFGRLMNYLEETGQREQTLVIFMSDHGEMNGDHGLYWKGAYFYEALVHIPLIMSCPSLFKSGLKSDALVELVDLAPTLMELTGQEVPYYMQGKSLLPILTGQAEPHHHKDSVYSEFYHCLLGSHDNIYATMYYDGRYKIVNYHGMEYGELYDHETYPQSSFSGLLCSL